MRRLALGPLRAGPSESAPRAVFPETEVPARRDLLGSGREAQRCLAEICHGHLPNESHNAILPFPTDLHEIRIVLLQASAHFYLQRVSLIAENVDWRTDCDVALHCRVHRNDAKFER